MHYKFYEIKYSKNHIKYEYYYKCEYINHNVKAHIKMIKLNGPLFAQNHYVCYEHAELLKKYFWR
jgi:hypothetical protein